MDFYFFFLISIIFIFFFLIANIMYVHKNSDSAKIGYVPSETHPY